MHLSVSPKVRNDGEVSPTALNFAGKWLLAGMAIHMRLKRTWTCESFVAHLAFMFFFAYLRKPWMRIDPSSIAELEVNFR